MDGIGKRTLACGALCAGYCDGVLGIELPGTHAGAPKERVQRHAEQCKGPHLLPQPSLLPYVQVIKDTYMSHGGMMF